MQIQDGPEILCSGDELRFTLWLGPLPIRWHAAIESVSDSGFADRQIEGPFAHWVHRHNSWIAGRASSRCATRLSTSTVVIPYGGGGSAVRTGTASALCLPRLADTAAIGVIGLQRRAESREQMRRGAIHRVELPSKASDVWRSANHLRHGTGQCSLGREISPT